MKKTWVLLLAVTVMLCCFSTAALADAVYTPGTYSASAYGFAGNVTATVEVTEDSIASVSFEGANETTSVGGVAMTRLAEEILAAQSVEVDAITGATLTSNGVLSAAADCLAQAKGQSVEIADVKMLPGTYMGYGWGFSQVRQVPVTITVNETNILSVKVETELSVETQHLMQTVIDLMVPRIVENNSLAVDAICGATSSANAVKAAIADGVAQALAAAGTPENAIEHFYEPLDLATNKTEEINVDVVVVGMGGSGTASALHTAEVQKAAGREVSVLALEKSGTYGGTSCATTSLLGFNSAKTEAMFGEMYHTDLDALLKRVIDSGDYDSNERNRAYYDHTIFESGKIVDWLIDHGFYFGAPRGFRGGVQNQFYYCDGKGELNLSRIHKCFDQAVSDYVELGGKYMLETEGYDLIYDAETKTVTGVKARNIVDGTEYIINAKAVILATGGFGGNSEMMIKYNGGDFWLYGMAQNDGKMFQAALDLGAGTLRLYDEASLYGGTHNISTLPQLHVFPYNFDPNGTIDIWRDDVASWSLNDVPNIIVASFDSMWVSKDGTRNVKEDLMWAWPVAGDVYYTIVNQAWIDNLRENGFDANRTELFCNAGFATFPLNMPIPEMDEVLAACEKEGIVTKAESITELAEKLGMDPAVLENTYNTYNKACIDGNDPLGKNAQYLKSIEGGTLYAFRAAPRPYSSVGGLNVTGSLEVLFEDGETVINGLFATGTDCLGVTHSVKVGLGAGCDQLWAYQSGNIAAESALAYIQK